MGLLSSGVVVADRYRLDRLLGEGGMGAVWSAARLDGGAPVALKFVKDTAGGKDLRRRFLREARAACAVRHPNVVAVHEILELEDGAPVMVMDLLVGEPLSERLRREHQLPLAAAARILLPVVSAVGTAHALGIVHRDLKPENIFLAVGDDGEDRVIVLDFGIAKLTATAGEAVETTGLTGTGALLGTPCFMAPEQVFGEKDIDHRADVWALGLILYQALSGILPTAADNVGQVLKIILTRPIWPLQEAATEVPAEIADLVNRMVTRQRSQRPEDLREVQQVLSRYADVSVPEFDAPTVRTSSRSSARRDVPEERRVVQVSTHADPLGHTADAAVQTRAIGDTTSRAGGRTVTVGVAATGMVVAGLALGMWYFSGPRGADADGSAPAVNVGASAQSAAEMPAAPLPDAALSAGGSQSSASPVPVASGGASPPASASGAATARAMATARSAGKGAPPRASTAPSSQAPTQASSPSAASPAIKVQTWD